MAGKGQSNSARTVSGRDGRGDPVAAADCADRAALPESWTRPPAVGVGEDAADLFPAAVVQPVGPAGRRYDLRQRSMRRFARVELDDDVVPDESTILRFRHLLEQ